LFLALGLQLGQAPARRQEPRLEFGFVEQPLAIGVDQWRDHPLEIMDQLVELLHLTARAGLRPLSPPLVLRPNPLGLGQEPTHIFPDGGVQDIGADLLVPAQALAAEAIGVGARAAVVGIADLAGGGGRAPRLAVAAVAAPLAAHQALKEETATAGPVATAAPILLELRLDRPEELGAHQPGDLDEDLFLRWCIDPRDRSPRPLGAAALRPEPLRLQRPRAPLAERGPPLVGGVLEHQPDRRAVPSGSPGPRRDRLTSGATADLTDRASFLADPREDLAHDPGLLGHDLIPRLAVALVLADVAVAVGRTAEHVDRAVAGGVLLPPPAARPALCGLAFGRPAPRPPEQVL